MARPRLIKLEAHTKESGGNVSRALPIQIWQARLTTVSNSSFGWERLRKWDWGESLWTQGFQIKRIVVLLDILHRSSMALKGDRLYIRLS